MISFQYNHTPRQGTQLYTQAKKTRPWAPSQERLVATKKEPHLLKFPPAYTRLFLTPVITTRSILLLLHSRMLMLSQLLLAGTLLLENLLAVNRTRDMFRKLAAGDESEDDTGSDDGGEDEAVYGVPVGSPAEAAYACVLC